MMKYWRIHEKSHYFLRSDEIRSDKVTELDGYNSATKTIVDKPKIEIGKITNELEIL